MNGGRIVCAVAEDQAARDVIDTGAAIAAATGLEPVFASVGEVEVSPSSTIVPAGAGIGWAPFPEGGFHAAQRRASERAAELLTELGVDEENSRACAGSPTDEIHDLAAELGAEAIVVGGEPRTGLSAIAMGSVARWLAVNGNYPVVFARSGGGPWADGPVVCGIDPDGDSATNVATVAARFAALAGEELVLVHVGQPGPAEERDVLEYENRLGDERRGARAAVEDIAARLPAAVTTDVVVDEGQEADRLVAQAKAHRASLVVTGNRGHGSIRSALTGSVSLELAGSAPQPVVVVPPNLGGS